MSISQNFPAIDPTLTLNFQGARRLDPRISFTRASTATYVGKDGLVKTALADEARFDHDPETGESLGLLIEESRTNIALNSENFSTRSATTYGTKSSVTTNATIAPDGTQTADLVTTVTTTTQNRLGNLHAVTSSQYYTYSVYVKQGNKSNVQFYLGYTALINANMTFTFATETLSAGGGTYLSGSAGFDKLDNGWYRLYFTGSSFNSGNTYSGFISDTVADQTFYIWGEQIEVGTFPTSYIPTSGSAATRSADNASITGTNFTSWYNSTEGTAIIEVTPKGVSNALPYQTYFSFNSSSGTRWGMAHQNELRGSYPSNAVLPYVGVNGGFSNIQEGNFTPNTTMKLAMHQPNGINIQSSRDGGVVNVTSTTRNPSINNLLLGGIISDNSHLMGHISKFIYYPERLTNAQLQTLTK